LGDPNCGEGTAITESLSISTEDAKSIFYNQWGLNTTNEVFSSGNTAAQAAGIKPESSIGLFNSESKVGIAPTRTISDNILGANVIVAVFDTSPFDLRGERVLDTEVTDPIDDFGSDIVNHFETIGDPDARDHGVFGASLVDVIAPESDIRFYRVLDQSNRGDLYTLLRALETLSQTWNVENPLVINMSLGIHPPPDSESEADLTILENILRSFYNRGAVIVAAAGNDSAERSLMGIEPAPMQYPAAYEFVIGVGASNAKNEMSCFSNNANILAPGGDNGTGCLPAVHECAVDGIGAAACMVGYVYTPPNAHYAYWNGTSFAAPLVSGAAALLMGEGLNRTNEEVYAILAPTLSGTTVAGAPISTPHVLDLADAVNQAAALPTPTPQPKERVKRE
jgi:subtilisin family serine protease